ncbi:Cytochrome P450 [Popillia japonica]|uniref:Cytochrome P450 n=1 Tax=Popillia japonica TaxID=7064 RepID=A0AAW1J0M1_POPJA
MQKTWCSSITERRVNILHEVIRDIINYRETHDVKRNDFVQLLLNIKHGVTNDGSSFTFNEIAAQAFVFFIDGFETPSSIMMFAFYEMAKNQDIQDKVREEIRRAVAKYDGNITYDTDLYESSF